MNFERAKEWGGLGFAVMVICCFCGYKFSSVDTYDAGKWRDAMNAEQMLNVDSDFSDSVPAPTIPKGTTSGYYFEQCKKNYEGVQDADCLKTQRDSNLAYSYQIKAFKQQKDFANTLIEERATIDKDYAADRNFIVQQVKQIAFDAGMKVSDIKSPVTTKESVALWLEDNNAGVWLAIVGFTGFLMCVPCLWLGFWRLVGAAYRSAKKEMKGDKK